MAKTIGAGFRYIFYGTVNQDSFVQGNDATGPVAGNQDGQGLLRLEGAVTEPLAPNENETITVTGDDEALVTFDFSATDLPSGVFETAVRDNNFEALLQGTKVQSIADLEIGVLQPRNQAFTDMCFLFQRRAKKWEAGKKGVSRWEILFAPKATATPLFNAMTERTHNRYRYSVTTSQSDRLPFGATLTVDTNGTTSAPLIPIDSDNPVHLHTFVGDGAETDFNLAYLPVSQAKIIAFEDGVATTVTGLTNQTITLSAPADGAIVNVLYEVDESDLE